MLSAFLNLCYVCFGAPGGCLKSSVGAVAVGVGNRSQVAHKPHLSSKQVLLRLDSEIQTKRTKQEIKHVLFDGVYVNYRHHHGPQRV